MNIDLAKWEYGYVSKIKPYKGKQYHCSTCLNWSYAEDWILIIDAYPNLFECPICHDVHEHIPESNRDINDQLESLEEE